MMEAIQCNGNNAVRLIQYYDQASPKFVRSLFNLGLVGNANVAPVVEDAVDSQYRGSLVAIVVDARHLLNFYVGLAHSKITSLVLMDGSMNLFFGQFTSTMTKRYWRALPRVPKTPYPGSLLVIHSFDIVRESDYGSDKCATVLINDCHLVTPPRMKQRLLISRGLTPGQEDSKTALIQSRAIEIVRRYHCLVLLSPFHLETKENISRDHPLRRNEEVSELAMPFPHRNHVELLALNEHVRSTFECSCVKVYGYERCLVSQYPVEQIRLNSVLNTMYRQIPGDPQCLDFDHLTNEQKTFMLNWWYSVNFFGSGPNRPQCEAVPVCVRERVSSLWPSIDIDDESKPIHLKDQPKINQHFSTKPRNTTS